MEKELTKMITNEEGKNIPVIDSREVAEMLGKSHSAVLKDIQGSNDGKTVGIIPTLLKSNFDLSKYFIESSYKDQSGKSNKCYLCTKMGCEMLGNKQQGEKGILFTAKYVERFNEMERKLKEISKPDSYMIDDPIERAKKWIEEREQYNKVVKELEDKNSFIGKISASENSLLVREVAKLASKGNVVIGEKALWNKLREWGYISQKSTEPMQSAINAGWFEVVERVVEHSGKTLVYKTTKVTGRGQVHIIKKLSKEFENNQPSGNSPSLKSENKLKKIQQ